MKFSTFELLFGLASAYNQITIEENGDKKNLYIANPFNATL